MQKEKKYFASGNSEKGFVSYYNEIYGGLNMVYIIKGGSGTGKSSFIRTIADAGEARGYSVEYFYCSSDPLSLDGIIIEELKTAVIDGTSPHNYDPKYPGVKDVILNFGDHWDSTKLKDKGQDICSLIDRKSVLYNNVYNYLAAAGRVEAELKLCNQKAVLFEKMEAAVQRLGKGWKTGSGFKKILRPVDGISHAGHITYGTYHLMAENRYVISDRYGIGCIFMEFLMGIARKKELKTVYSPCFLDVNSICAIYLPEVSTSFVITDDDGFEKTINMDRFVDVDIIRRNKQKNRFARRCLNSLYEGVQKGFDEIYELHSRLEKCYIGAMDFSKNTSLAQEIIKEIF